MIKSSMFIMLSVMMFVFSMVLLPIQASGKAPASPSSNTPNLDKVFEAMISRVQYGLTYVGKKFNEKSVVERRAHEVMIAGKKIADASKFNLTEEQVETFFWGQMEALKIVMYNELALNTQSVAQHGQDFDYALSQVKALDGQMLQHLANALVEIQRFDRLTCIGVVNNYIGNMEGYYYAALYRASSIFLDLCLIM